MERYTVHKNGIDWRVVGPIGEYAGTFRYEKVANHFCRAMNKALEEEREHERDREAVIQRGPDSANQ